MTLPLRAGDPSSTPGTKSLALFCSLTLLKCPWPHPSPRVLVSAARGKPLLNRWPKAAVIPRAHGPVGQQPGFVWTVLLLASLGHSWGLLVAPLRLQASLPGLVVCAISRVTCLHMVVPGFFTGQQRSQRQEKATPKAPGPLAKGPPNKVSCGASPGLGEVTSGGTGTPRLSLWLCSLSRHHQGHLWSGPHQGRIAY